MKWKAVEMRTIDCYNLNECIQLCTYVHIYVCSSALKLASQFVAWTLVIILQGFCDLAFCQYFNKNPLREQNYKFCYKSVRGAECYESLDNS